ncbi:phosphotransferase family protein [Sphingobium lactosutens]|uniref:phosphotransferase family protein n=1 Tax=Sphingobium lactosutens TaxID=522773 RepID=UPI0015BA4040|nr:phosphotransferase [Sphingobium lactosutens]
MSHSTAPALLSQLPQMDCAWLNAALHAGGFPEADVASFAIRPIGAGNVSDTVRVELAYRSHGPAPSSIICKFSSSHPDNHAHGVGSGSYYREVNSYEILKATADCCCIPRPFWVAGGPDNINLVMEDLSEDTRAGDQIAGCGPDDAASVIVELAKLHRAFFPMAREDAPVWGMTMADTADYWVAAIERALPVIREHVSGRLTPEEMATVEEARVMAPSWYRLPVLHGTLTHGDPRVDNILFRDGKDGVQAILIDWQMTGWRNPMHDVGYFLSGSVSVDDRRAHERALLSLYAKTLGDEREYGLEMISEDYRLQLLSGLMTTIASYGVLPLNAVTDRLMFTLLRRNVAAAMDWESLSSISKGG